MPVYTYRCRECKCEMEELQKMDDEPPPRCPACEAEGTLERILAPCNFELVGSGWAKDGYS